MIVNIIEMIAGAVFDFLNTIFGLLPEMPFGPDDLEIFQNDSIVMQALGWLNWLLPVQMAAGVVALWATAMLAYIGVKLSIKYSSKLA